MPLNKETNQPDIWVYMIDIKKSYLKILFTNDSSH